MRKLGWESLSYRRKKIYLRFNIVENKFTSPYLGEKLPLSSNPFAEVPTKVFEEEQSSS